MYSSELAFLFALSQDSATSLTNLPSALVRGRSLLGFLVAFRLGLAFFAGCRSGSLVTFQVGEIYIMMEAC